MAAVSIVYLLVWVAVVSLVGVGLALIRAPWWVVGIVCVGMFSLSLILAYHDEMFRSQPDWSSRLMTTIEFEGLLHFALSVSPVIVGYRMTRWIRGRRRAVA